MANRKTSYMQRQRAAALKKQKAKRRARYFRRGAIIFLEVLMILILSICCYGVNILNRMSASDFDRSKIYVAPVERQTTAEVLTEAMTEQYSVEVVSVEELSSAVAETPETEEVPQTEAPTETMPPVPAETEPYHGEDEVLSLQNVVNGYWNILLVGVDARNQSEMASGHQSDTMIICSINVNTKEIKLASVYRDTLMKMYSNGVYDKANAEIAKSDYMNMISMINMNLDLQIQDVILVNWAVMANYINAIGGIYLEITEGDIEINPNKEHTAIMQGYITEIVNNTGIYSPQITSAGYQLCNGVWAVAYCRNRYTVNVDYGRTERQREVVNKVLDRTKELVMNGDYGVILKALTEACSNVLTSLSPGDIFQLAMYAANFNIVDTVGFPFDKRGTLGKYMGVDDPVIPIDFANNVVQLHRFLYGEDGYSPSPNVQEISYTIRQQTGF